MVITMIMIITITMMAITTVCHNNNNNNNHNNRTTSHYLVLIGPAFTFDYSSFKSEKGALYPAVSLMQGTRAQFTLHPPFLYKDANPKTTQTTDEQTAAAFLKQSFA